MTVWLEMKTMKKTFLAYCDKICKELLPDFSNAKAEMTNSAFWNFQSFLRAKYTPDQSIESNANHMNNSR